MVDIENFEPKNSHDRKLKEMLQHFWLPNALFAAVELDIAELLKTGSKSISKLALLANSNEESLYKLLRLFGNSRCSYLFDLYENNQTCSNRIIQAPDKIENNK